MGEDAKKAKRVLPSPKLQEFFFSQNMSYILQNINYGSLLLTVQKLLVLNFSQYIPIGVLSY